MVAFLARNDSPSSMLITMNEGTDKNQQSILQYEQLVSSSFTKKSIIWLVLWLVLLIVNV